ncbi:hypothetical protein Tco_0476019 [Tanacetum coccineum]
MWRSIQKGPYKRPMIPVQMILECRYLNHCPKCLSQTRSNTLLMLMYGSDVTNHIRHSRLMDEFDKFAAKEGESLESVYKRLTTLVNIMDLQFEQHVQASKAKRAAIMCSTSSDMIATITDKLDNLGRDMKKLKKNIHAIQVGCENCVGMHLDKELRSFNMYALADLGLKKKYRLSLKNDMPLRCMTRSSTKELFTPFKELEREFRSSRKLLKTLSLDESRSLEFNLFFDIEEYVRKEAVSDHEVCNEHIEKVHEVVDLFHIPNITQDQVMLRAFPMTLTRAAGRWLRNKPSGSITNWEDLKTKFLSKYCPHARTAKKMEEIYNFQQEVDETLYQAWEHDAVVVRDFYKKFYNSLGGVPKHVVSQ